MKRASREGRPGLESRRGFTLIELIVTLAILVIVLGMAYQILENCLRTERWVERASRPEEIGQAIISLIRKDLEGTVYRNIGSDRVFQVIDGGSGPAARDELQLYTTQEPTPPEEMGDGGVADETLNHRTITAVTYYLKENSQGLYTLFRRENVGTETDPFLGGGGINREIYDKVKSLSFLCFDATAQDQLGGQMWVESWDSAQQILLASQDEEAQAAQQGGIPKISGSGKTATPRPGATPTSAPADSGAVEGMTTLLPPAAIPTAVRIEITIYTGDERGLYRNADGTPMAPQLFTAIVPILTAQRIPLSSLDDAMGDGKGGAGGPGSGATVSGPLTRSGKGGGKGGGPGGKGGGNGGKGGPPGGSGRGGPPAGGGRGSGSGAGPAPAPRGGGGSGKR
jgi:prepilin-type N-terminal cleavage/methylation domain-containing protein